VTRQVLERHGRGLSRHRLGVRESVKQWRYALAGSAGSQRQGRRDADLAALVPESHGQGRGRCATAEDRQPLDRGQLLCRITSLQLRDQCRHLLGAGGQGFPGGAVTVDPGHLAEAVELQFHQTGHSGVVAAEPQRLSPAQERHGPGPHGQELARRPRRCRLSRRVAANAASGLARTHVDPRHLVELAAPLRVHGLESDGHVGRHFDRKRAVRCQRHRAQVDDLAARVDDV
jgi:hypothetical protein